MSDPTTPTRTTQARTTRRQFIELVTAGSVAAGTVVMLGKPVDGTNAERLGMVTRVVEPDRLMEETLAFANQLASKPAVSLRQIKRVFREALDLPLRDALVIEQDAYYKAARSEETRALFRARGQAPDAPATSTGKPPGEQPKE